MPVPALRSAKVPLVADPETVEVSLPSRPLATTAVPLTIAAVVLS